jgi:hypothetical protein
MMKETTMQSHSPFDGRRLLGDLIGQSRKIKEAQGYVTMCWPMCDVSVVRRARPLLRLLLNEIHFAMMRYCAPRAWDLAPVALLFAPPPEVARLAGRTALVYGHSEGRWVCQEVVSVFPPTARFAAAAPHSDPNTERASPWSSVHPIQAANGGAAARYGEFNTLDDALAAALMEGYVWLAAILERGDAEDGFDWQPIAQA